MMVLLELVPAVSSPRHLTSLERRLCRRLTHHPHTYEGSTVCASRGWSADLAPVSDRARQGETEPNVSEWNT